VHHLRVYASQLRKKLGPDGAPMLVAEPGIGYRLLDPSADENP
jgi:DNA-binding response OmpR family regulator